MDGNEKKSIQRARFNLLDAVVILLVVLCLVGVYFRYTIMERIGLGDDLSQFEISFKMTNVDASYDDYIMAGHDVYFTDGTVAGTLLSYDGKLEKYVHALGDRPAEVVIEDADGNLVLATYEAGTRIDAEGSFVCEGVLSDNGYFHVGGERLLGVGQTVTLCTDYATFTVCITNISKLSYR